MRCFCNSPSVKSQGDMRWHRKTFRSVLMDKSSSRVRNNVRNCHGPVCLSTFSGIGITKKNMTKGFFLPVYKECPRNYGQYITI